MKHAKILTMIILFNLGGAHAFAQKNIVICISPRVKLTYEVAGGTYSLLSLFTRGQSRVLRKDGIIDPDGQTLRFIENRRFNPNQYTVDLSKGEPGNFTVFEDMRGLLIALEAGECNVAKTENLLRTTTLDQRRGVKSDGMSE